MTALNALKRNLLGGLCLVVVGGMPALVRGQELPQTTDFEIRRLNDVVDLQRQQIEQQEQALRDQRRRLEALERAFLGPPSMQQATFTPAITAPVYPAERRAAEARVDAQTAQADGESVGEPRNSDERLRAIEDIAGLREVGGVLTKPGTLVFEPSIEYEQSSTNRFFFSGVQVADVVLIGDIQVSDADRDSVTAVAVLRTGVTDRSEVDIRVPYVYRDDRVTQTGTGLPADGQVSDLDNADLGDIEIAGRYQFNSGSDGLPIFIGNLRVKAPTGVGPFDLDRNASGIPIELSTGSGFWGVEPSVTWIFPTDPAVFYGNFSYLWNIEDDVDENVGGSLVTNVDPGDVFGIAFGMGYSLNERTSFSVGYDHKFVFETDQVIDGTSFSSEEFDVGSLSFGYSYALSDSTSLNLTLQTGVTEDAPDVRMLLRVPIKFDIF